jgi:hypothetical protein
MNRIVTKDCVIVSTESGMSKEELINCICEINKSARREFLQSFTTEDLDEYLEHLMSLDLAEVGVGA